MFYFTTTIFLVKVKPFAFKVQKLSSLGNSDNYSIFNGKR